MTPADTAPAFSDHDQRHMRRALALAERGRGRVEPNPMVGCVLVRAERVVGEGYHRYFGGPHAEVDALRRAGEQARGATAYVTLEPCCHVGKTGPCTEALLAAGVSRVVAAMADPFPKVAGGGLQQLRDAGVDVAVGLCEPEAQRLNAPYLKRLRTATPWVILKWAQSLDGCLASRTGMSQWITGQAARREAHRIRGQVDAVIAGAGTVIADDPQLTCRMVRPRRIARRVVVDGRLRIPLESALVRTARDWPTAIVCTQEAARSDAARVAALREAGCELVELPAVAPGRVDLNDLLRWLGGHQATNVMVEGGGHLLGAFLDQRLADELAVFVAPMLIGGADPAGRPPAHEAAMAQPAPSFFGFRPRSGPALAGRAVVPWPAGVPDLAQAPHVEHLRIRQLGPDLYLSGHLRWP